LHESTDALDVASPDFGRADRPYGPSMKGARLEAAGLAVFLLLASTTAAATPQSRLGRPIALVGRTGLNPAMMAAASANGVQAFAWIRFDRDVKVPSRYAGPTSVVQARIRRQDGTLSPPHTLSRRNGRAFVPAVGVDGNGVVTVAWLQQVRRGDLRLVVSVRPPRGRFGRPVTIGRTRVPSLRALYPDLLRVPYGAEPALAVGADGAAVSAWRGSGSLQVATRRRGRGAHFSRPQSFPLGAEPNVALDARDRAYVTWTTLGGTGAIGTTGTGVDLAVAPVGHSLRPTTVSPAGERPRDPALAVTQDGTAIVVWADIAGHTGNVQTVVRNPAGTLSAPLTLSDASRFPTPPPALFGGSSPTVIANPQGEAIVVWQQETIPETGGGLATATWSSGAFGPSQVVDAGASFDPALAVDGRGETVLAYLSGANGFGSWQVRPPGGSFAPSQGIPGSLAFVVSRGRNAVTLGVRVGVTGARTRLYDAVIG
jgi:hypothetical protein